MLALTLTAVADRFPEGTSRTSIWDYSGSISSAERESVEEVVKEFQSHHPSGIWVILVPSLSKYQANPHEIESYAEWLLKDHLPTFGADQSSILLLISRDDRKARIELGRDWGRQWDHECKRIMGTFAVPLFREGHYAGGIRATVRELDAMVGQIKATHPALLFLGSWSSKLLPYSLLSPLATLPSIAVCIGLFLLGLKAETSDGRQVRILAYLGLFSGLVISFGGGLLELQALPGVVDALKIVGLFVGVAFLLILDSYTFGFGAYFFNARSNSWNSGSWDSSDSFFSGGGGGGATGSW